jgi:predicted porin
MFKKLALVAALAACFASAAQAQSNVTIYGRLNVTAERQDLDGNTQTVLSNNASRIGFKGTEDIGNGLKAGFVLESGFDATTGAADSRFWGRESTVNLSSNAYGTVRLGNLTASEAYFATADYVSMHNHDTGSSSDAFYALGFNLATGRLTNGVAYTSPVINGFRGDVQVGLNDGEGDRRIALAANYDAGPLHLGAGYEDFNGMKALTIRGLYEMGPWTFGGYVEQDSGNVENARLLNDFLDNGVLNGALANGSDVKRTNLRVSAMYTMGASEFHANYGNAGEINSISGTGADQYTLGYNYNLSKRTKVYGYYTAIKSDGIGGAVQYGSGTTDFSSFAVGLRHNF